MTRPTHAGFTLLELAIAMSLGALVMTGLLQVFQSLSRSFATQQNIAALHNTARYAETQLREAIQPAGFVEAPWVIAHIDPFSGSAPQVSFNSDLLVTRRYDRRNCLGNKNPQLDSTGQPAPYLLESHFLLRDEQLVQSCWYGPAAGPAIRQINAMTLVEHVEALRFEFLRKSGSDPSINQWVRGGQWQATDAIAGVRFAMVLVSPDPLKQRQAEVVELLGSPYTAPQDGHARLVTHSTIASLVSVP